MPKITHPDTKEQDQLLTRMIATRTESDHVAARSIYDFCVGPHVHWTRLLLDDPIDLGLAQKWEQEHGPWDHGFSGRETPHNVLGMAFAQWASERNAIQELTLNDEPDFSGQVGSRRITGDIGQCSAGAMINGLRRLGQPGCLWMSILGASEQIILEFNYSISETIGSILSESMSRIRKARLATGSIPLRQ